MEPSQGCLNENSNLAPSQYQPPAMGTHILECFTSVKPPDMWP
jgi:hypothetical protein